MPKLKSEQFGFAPRKFAAAELTPCERSGKAGAGQGMPPVHMEARVTALHQLREKLSAVGGGMAAEADVARVHVADDFLLQDKYINPANWSPLIYNFQHFRSAG